MLTSDPSVLPTATIPARPSLQSSEKARNSSQDCANFRRRSGRVILSVGLVQNIGQVTSTEHPHGLSDRDFDSLFTADKPIIFNFHGYPWLIHRLAYRRTNHGNMHVRGYKEKGNINTPMELAINNEIDRFTLAIEAIDRAPKVQKIGAHAKEKYRDQQIDCRNYAYQHGIDKPEMVAWR
jgi:phosphoketolase